MDPRRPHDIDDVWGFLRVRRFRRGRSLVTVGVALDLGPGPVRWLFEERIRKIALETPRRVRDYVERTSPAARTLAQR
jgi:hypothetical protein